MKQGWEIKTIGDICDIKTGKLDANASSEDGQYPFFTCSTEPLRIDNYAYDCECVLIAGNGDLNVKYYNGKFNAYQRTYIITTKTEVENIITKYLYKFFSKYIEQLRKLSIGGVIKYIKLGNLTDATIPIPPIEEQERIVEELDCLSGVIEKKREQLKELDALAESIFYTMFGDPITNEKGWEVKRLGEICYKITDGTHDTPERLKSGIKFITGKHIRAGIIDYDNSDYVLESVHKEIYARCNPEYGDVLYTNIGANLGTAAVNIVHYEFSMKNVALLKLNCIIANGYYVQTFLNNEHIRDSIINGLSNGGAQKFLSLRMIEQIKIKTPPLALQQEFADKIEAIEKQKELIKQSITETEELFNSRMNYYFN